MIATVPRDGALENYPLYGGSTQKIILSLTARLRVSFRASGWTFSVSKSGIFHVWCGSRALGCGYWRVVASCSFVGLLFVNHFCFNP